ncbi:hypothetical protein B7463_g9207, partial [Scytalidium lignicola]
MDATLLTGAINQPPQSRKRNRPTVSCGHCRIRKLKCSRTQPCDSCLRTGDSATCYFETSPGSREDKDTLDPATKHALTARIDKLEAMLLSVMSNEKMSVMAMPKSSNQAGGDLTSVLQSSSTKDEGRLHQMVSAFGAMKVDQSTNKTIYIDGSHWVSIMTEIDELRKHLLDNHEDWERNALKHRDWIKGMKVTASLLRGIAAPAAQEQLLSYLPSKLVTDRLVDRYFHVYNMTLPIIHEPTFRREYVDHWKDHTKTKVVWLGLLFAILHLAEISYRDQNDAAVLESISTYKLNDEYKRSIVRCLVSSDYTNPVMYTVDTIVLYVTSEWMTTPDANLETSMVLGLAIRLAMRMGIHRDSKWQPQITPWQGEMRRRLWAVLQGTDIQYSFHLSIPPNIRPSDCDCALPRNIYNDEFGKDTLDLPPSRPYSEQTEVCYTICKAKLDLVLGNILNLVNSPGIPKVYDVHKQENALAQAWNTIPPHLLKSYDRPNANFAKWKELQSKLNRSTLFLELNAIFWQDPPNVWEMSALTTPDFFTAGMAVSLDLYYGVKTGLIVADATHDKQLFEMISALETSLNIWRLFKEMSIEAAKAHGMFSFVLSKVLENKTRIGIARDGDLATSQSESRNLNTSQIADIPQYDSGFWNLHNDTIDYETFFQWPSSADGI